jgi:hypothetical protein
MQFSLVHFRLKDILVLPTKSMSQETNNVNNYFRSATWHTEHNNGARLSVGTNSLNFCTFVLKIKRLELFK